jgi:hypothetical protein
MALNRCACADYQYYHDALCMYMYVCMYVYPNPHLHVAFVLKGMCMRSGSPTIIINARVQVCSGSYSK